MILKNLHNLSLQNGMKTKHRPIIGITMGDASGVGPEIICKMFLQKSYQKYCDIIIIGNQNLFEKTINHYNFKIKMQNLNQVEDVCLLDIDTLGIINIEEQINIDEFDLGKPYKEAGFVALKSINKAVELARTKKIDGIVTAPLNKEVVALTYKKFSGHTEYIAQILKVRDFNMMMVSKRMKVTLVTTHIAIKNISKQITKNKIKTAIKNTYQILIQLGYRNPKIAVLALNPHAGDGGLFGNEEDKIVRPAIIELRKQNIKSEGPFVPDSFFFKYKQYPVYDAVIALYHDQGLIPFKMLSFGSGINVTIGLPVIRTSVDHGTAYDIAGKNKANDRSLFEALKFAVNLAKYNTTDTQRL